jgi:hypothetical protein
VTSSELEILQAIQREGGVAGVTTISAACDLTSGYADFLCRYLRRGGYLSLAGRAGVYRLTPKGEAALPPLFSPQSWGGERGGEAQEQGQIIQSLYRAIQDLTRQLESGMGRGLLSPGGRPPGEIAIETSFVDLLEGQDVGIEASFDEIGALEETASDIAEAVAALRNLKAGSEEQEE